MEENFIFSLNFCRNIVEQTIVARATRMFPPGSREVGQFSYEQTSSLSDALLACSDYPHDTPSPSLHEDPPRSNPRRQFKITPPCPSRQSSKTSKFSLTGKSSQASANQLWSGHQRWRGPQGVGLVPLTESGGESSCESSEQDQMEVKLRERKIHQQMYRTKYEQNLKQSNLKKRQNHNVKNDKSNQYTTAYDFDGSIIEHPSGKPENAKVPTHFLELEVFLPDRDSETHSEKEPKRKQAKLKTVVKAELPGARQEDIRAVESCFLRDLGNFKLAEGVQLRQSKEQCRKILGYTGPARKKRMELLKSGESGPVRMRMEELASYKNLISANSQMCISREQEKNESEKSLPPREESRLFDTENAAASRFIKVTNTKALQFLLCEDSEPDKRGVVGKRGGKTAKSVQIAE